MNAVLEAPSDVSVRFSLEPYSEKLIQEMRPLWDAHHTEIPQLGLDFDPDLTAYRTMQKVGVLRIFTARLGGSSENGMSVLAGYQIFFVMKHPHRKYSLEANSDILYLDPEVRKGLVGLKFLRWCDLELEKEGVRVIHHQVSLQKDLGALFLRMGYEAMDITFAKKIGGI